MPDGGADAVTNQSHYLVWALALGALLDAVLGDPREWPHPVRAIGWLIAASETRLRAMIALVERRTNGLGTNVPMAIEPHPTPRCKDVPQLANLLIETRKNHSTPWEEGVGGVVSERTGSDATVATTASIAGKRFAAESPASDGVSPPPLTPLSQAGEFLGFASQNGRASARSANAERCAGVALAAIVVGATCLAVWLVLTVCDHFGPVASVLGRACLVYWGLAARSLGDEAARAVGAADLATARRELSMIVGRDTDSLEMPEICRASVETVAENCSDAVVAPIFWYLVSGPIGLWGFKAISTLDSMVGYRNARYRHFGWASARLDDLANLIPARLTWLLISAVSLPMGESAGAALGIGWRDGRKHPSPNAGWGEAAMAGALGIQLGGTSTYSGVTSEKPTLGVSIRSIDRAVVHRSIRLMKGVSALAVILASAIFLVRSAMFSPRSDSKPNPELRQVRKAAAGERNFAPDSLPAILHFQRDCRTGACETGGFRGYPLG